jgi:hypothetical protein
VIKIPTLDQAPPAFSRCRTSITTSVVPCHSTSSFNFTKMAAATFVIACARARARAHTHTHTHTHARTHARAQALTRVACGRCTARSRTATRTSRPQSVCLTLARRHTRTHVAALASTLTRCVFCLPLLAPPSQITISRSEYFCRILGLWSSHFSLSHSHHNMSRFVCYVQCV